MLTLIGFAGLATGVALALRSVNRTTTADLNRAREADRLGQILVAQDQAPHTVALPRAASPRRALERTIAADMTGRIRRHELSGPLQRSRCTATRGRHARRRPFRCTVKAGDVSYPFLGVVDLRARRITWCKRDPPPSPRLDIPVSGRCRA